MKESYSNFLKLLNLTEEEFLFEINKHPVSYRYTDIVVVKKSNIEGVGCFSKITYEPDQIIGEGLYGDFKTELGRYINHSDKPNTYLKAGKFIALKKITPGEELLVNYFTNIRTLYKEMQFNERESITNR